jgi:hypothetical protein
LRYLGRVQDLKFDQVRIDYGVEELLVNSDIAEDLVGAVIYKGPGGD